MWEANPRSSSSHPQENINVCGTFLESPPRQNALIITVAYLLHGLFCVDKCMKDDVVMVMFHMFAPSLLFEMYAFIRWEIFNVSISKYSNSFVGSIHLGLNNIGSIHLGLNNIGSICLLLYYSRCMHSFGGRSSMYQDQNTQTHRRKHSLGIEQRRKHMSPSLLFEMYVFIRWEIFNVSRSKYSNSS